MHKNILVTISIAVISVFSTLPCYAGTCDDFIRESGAVRGAPDCKVKCSAARVGMGNFHCPDDCVRYCNYGLDDYDEASGDSDDTQISDDDASQAVDEKIKDLCAFTNNLAFQPSITTAIDSVTKVSGSGTLLMSAGNLSRMAQAKSERARAHAGLDLYSGLSPIGGTGKWELAVNDFKRLMDAFNAGPSGIQNLGRELVRENKNGSRKLNPRPNLPAVCQ